MSTPCIPKLNTTAYHPQSHGMVERFNRNLKTMIRTLVDQFGTKWDRHLPGLLWANRNIPHKSTGEKPSFLLDCHSPTEAALLPLDTMEAAKISDYRYELMLSLSTACENKHKNHTRLSVTRYKST